MKRFFSGLFLAVLGMAACYGAGAQSRPVNHEEAITVHVLDGRSQAPIAHRHVWLIGGYDRADLKRELWRQEVVTDEMGEVRLSRELLNLPWLQVWVAGARLCQSGFAAEDLNVERIREDGYSAPNHCGDGVPHMPAGHVAVFALEERKAGKARKEMAAAMGQK